MKVDLERVANVALLIWGIGMGVLLLVTLGMPIFYAFKELLR